MFEAPPPHYYGESWDSPIQFDKTKMKTQTKKEITLTEAYEDYKTLLKVRAAALKTYQQTCEACNDSWKRYVNIRGR